MSFVRMVAMTLTAVLLAVIPAFGNTVANARISGSVDFTGMGSSQLMPPIKSSPVAVLQSAS